MTEQCFMTISCNDCQAVCPDFDDLPRIREWLTSHVTSCGSTYYKEIIFNVELVGEKSIFDGGQ